MIETIGKKLCQARLARGLSIDEAAHATRVRPEKLIALENDDYSRFGSNAYAKGFLQIYGRFLGVDVSDQMGALETPRYMTISDYQYLNNVPEPEPSRPSTRHQQYENRRPSVMPLLIFMGLILVALVGALGIWVNVNMQRLEPNTASQTKGPKPQNAPISSVPSTTSEGTLAGNQLAAPDATTSVNPQLNESGLVAIGEPKSPTPKLDITVGAGGQAAQTAPLSQVPTIAGTPGVVTTSPGVNELILQPLKTTWVKVRRDSATGESIFEGDIYPNTRPLKLHGTRFFVEVRDQDAVQIRKNGNPIAYQAPGISIQ
ncbi:helix-turn-helix domain-containing protein [Verrucomicrobiota bacterium sgz303538]